MILRARLILGLLAGTLALALAIDVSRNGVPSPGRQGSAAAPGDAGSGYPAVLDGDLPVAAPGSESGGGLQTGFPEAVRRFNEGVTLPQLVRLCLFWAAAANVLVLLLLAVSAPWWVGPEASGPVGGDAKPAGSQSGRGPPRFLVVAVVAGAGALLLFQAAPRIGHSLWGDEESTLRWHMHGQWERQSGINGGRPFFNSLPWENTLWGYHNTNNHFLYSASGRLALEAWRAAGNHKRWRFSEGAMRLLPLLAALAALPLWAGLAARVGFPGAGLLLVLLLAIHPWFARYASEARGYAYVFALLPVFVRCGLRAVDDGRWRWWAAFGATQVLTLLSWPGMAFYCVAFGLGMLAAMANARETEPGRGSGPGAPAFRDGWKRWLITETLAVMLVVQCVSPAIPQVIPYLLEGHLDVRMGTNWVWNLAGFFTSGAEWVPYRGGPAENPLQVTVAGMVETRPWTRGVLVLLAILAVAGFVRVYRRGVHGALLVVTALLPPVVLWAVAKINDAYLFQWYFVYALPWFLFFVSAGFTGLFDWVLKSFRVPRGPASATTGAITAAGFAAVYFVTLLEPKHRVQRNHSHDPLRESVLLTRPSTSPLAPSSEHIITAQVNFGAYSYDPHGFLVESVTATDDARPGLSTLMRWSDTQHRPLFVNVGFLEDARRKLPNLAVLLENPELFERIAVLPALEPQLVRVVFRYRGGLFEAFDPTTNP